jgi:hypothetical protein
MRCRKRTWLLMVLYFIELSLGFFFKKKTKKKKPVNSRKSIVLLPPWIWFYIWSIIFKKLRLLSLGILLKIQVQRYQKKKNCWSRPKRYYNNHLSPYYYRYKHKSMPIDVYFYLGSFLSIFCLLIWRTKYRIDKPHNFRFYKRNNRRYFIIL